MLKKINSTKYYLFFIFLSIFFIAQPLFAIGLKDGFSNTGDLDKFAQTANYPAPTGPEFYIGLLLKGLFSLLGILTIALIFYSGFVWMTARGNEAKVTKAKDNLTDALIGLMFIIGAYALTTFLLKIFT